MQPGIRTPVAMGDVDLLEGPRVFAFLDVSEPYEAKLRIGMDVKMVIGEIRKDEKGNSLYCYMFRPI
jgi:uncharacterized OB-fold protein